jgi:predicted transcriptional regulator
LPCTRCSNTTAARTAVDQVVTAHLARYPRLTMSSIARALHTGNYQVIQSLSRLEEAGIVIHDDEPYPGPHRIRRVYYLKEK